MECILVFGMTLYYDSEDHKALDEIVIACERSVQTIKGSSGLEVPQDCRVYLLTICHDAFSKELLSKHKSYWKDDAILVFGI